MLKADSVYLQEILDLIKEIENFTSDYTVLTFIDDVKTIKAVAIDIQFLGETANQLSASLTQKHPEIPWRKIIGLRHKIVHHYMDIDPETLWDIIQKDIPTLKSQLTTVLKNLKAQEAKSPSKN